LWSILNDQRTADNVRDRFWIGTKEYHESAFAVYREVGGYVVSRLLVPHNISIDVLDEQQLHGHVGIDAQPLTHILPSSDATLKYDLAIEDADESAFSERTKQALERLEADPDINGIRKHRLRTTIIGRELKIRQPKPAPRDDLVLQVHNHPLLPFQYENIGVLAPSLSDLVCCEELFRANPSLVEAIVMADGHDQAMLLYAADPQKDLRSTDIYKDSDYSIGVDEAFLNSLGYKAVILSLGRNGRPKRDQRQKVIKF